LSASSASTTAWADDATGGGQWRKDTILIYKHSQGMASAATRYAPVGPSSGLVWAATQADYAHTFANGGYLTNFTIGWAHAIPATTNIVFAIQTNVISDTLPALVDTPLVLTFSGGGNRTTNTTTQFVNLPSSNTVVVLRATCSATIATGTLIGSVEHWYEVP
jgi:hypothetical protein